MPHLSHHLYSFFSAEQCTNSTPTQSRLEGLMHVGGLQGPFSIALNAAVIRERIASLESAYPGAIACSYLALAEEPFSDHTGPALTLLPETIAGWGLP
jgi:hypothetical protein